MSEITIVIQGPLSHFIYSRLHKYKKYGKVIVSTWDYVDVSVLPKDIKVISTPLPDKSLSNTISNFYYAICGMDNAMKYVKTKYCIRTRGDEFYENLDNFIEKFFENKNKIVFGNIFSKRWVDRPLHVGDHIYIGETLIFKKVYKLLRDMYDKKTSLKEWAIPGSNDIDPIRGVSRVSQPEVILAKAFFFVKKIPKKLWYDKKNFLINFEIFDINKTKPFIASWQNGNKTYVNRFRNPHFVKNTNDI